MDVKFQTAYLFIALVLLGCTIQPAIKPDKVKLISTIRGCAAQETDSADPIEAPQGTAEPPRIEIAGNRLKYSRAISHPCCRKVEITKAIYGKGIEISEEWSGSPCDCICFSSIEATLENLDPGPYSIQVLEKDRGTNIATLLLEEKVEIR